MAESGLSLGAFIPGDVYANGFGLRHVTHEDFAIMNKQLISLNPTELCELDFDAALDAVVAAFDWANHPYNRWMNAEERTRAEFLQSQVPFLQAIQTFPCALAMLVGKMSSIQERMHVYENVAEEHGYGALERTHVASFMEFLTALGCTDKELAEFGANAGVLAFSQNIRGFVAYNSASAAAAMLGTIERVYVDVSAAIARRLRETGWTEPGAQHHYDVHEELDVEHAADLLVIAERNWNRGYAREEIAQGLLLGAFYMSEVYRSMRAMDLAADSGLRAATAA